MRLSFLSIFIFSISGVTAQKTGYIKGVILNKKQKDTLANVLVELSPLDRRVKTGTQGEFIFKNLPNGTFQIRISAINYSERIIPITINKQVLFYDLGTIFLETNFDQVIDEGIITLLPEDLDLSDATESSNITGILTSSLNLFQRTTAYEFSPTFFRPRQVDSKYQTVMLNGHKINQMFTHRVEWSNIGGLNDVLRHQEISEGFNPSPYNFNEIGGTTNISTISKAYRKGLKLSYAMSNRTYLGRAMLSYHSGTLANGWNVSVSGSYRFGSTGFKEGTPYLAGSIFTAIDKKLSNQHQLNFTALYAYNQRGKSGAITNEVYRLKANDYNPNWGTQQGKVRSARIKEVSQPIFQMNHFYQANEKLKIHSNLNYQFGQIANSRLDYGGAQIVEDGEGNKTIIGRGINPDPTYYQKLPSYFLRDQQNPDYEKAYLAEQDFLENGQIKWQSLYEANTNNNDRKNAIYALYNDVREERLWAINNMINWNISHQWQLNTTLSYKNFKGEHYARMEDLLGAEGFLDVDIYADNIVEAQNNLQNPNRIITKGEKFKYRYNLYASQLNGFVQLNYHTKKLDLKSSLQWQNSTYQREGLYENGKYPGNLSLGKSMALNFNDFGINLGGLYKLTGRHILRGNIEFFSKPPSLKNTFSNIRESNRVVDNLASEKIAALDLSYLWRHQKFETKISIYGINIKDQTEISFYYADGLVGLDQAENTAFVQEVLTGVGQQHFGLEWASTINLTSSLKLKGVASIGQAIYNNNPNLYITSDAFAGTIDYGSAALKNYFMANGPQQAFSLGFEYSDPKYWWIGLTGNFFNKTFVDIAPIIRTKNFYLDQDGLPINDYDEAVAQQLLRQEKFDSYFLVNAVGGKSWKIKNYYVGCFVSLSNILNTKYQTGGYEQSRNANYKTLLEDRTREKPLFGPKYWYGYGTTFFVSIYVRI